jgi:CHAD domain-containing protein
LRRLGELGALDGEDRHTLRLSVKNLRYAAEFFAGAFPDEQRAQRQFARSLENIQNDLGRLNDLVVHERLRDDFMRDWTTSEPADQGNTTAKAFAMGFVLGRQQHEKAGHLAAIADEAKRLARIAPFWA